MTKENNIIFRPSWFKTLSRWEPDMVVEFLNALNDFNMNQQVNITNERVMDLWEQAEVLLNSDRNKYNTKVEVNRENGKKGGRPPKTQSVSNEPTITEKTQSVLEKPKESEPNPKNPKDKEKDNDNENDNEKCSVGENTLQFTIKTLIQPSEVDIELFDIMFQSFNEPKTSFDELFDLWWKLPQQEQDDSIEYYPEYIKWANNNKKPLKLYYYLNDKKYNWSSLRN